MFTARKYLGFILISILAITSFAFAGTARIKGDIAGVDVNTQTMLLSTDNGFVQMNLSGSVLKRNGMGILPEEFQIGERAHVTYDPTTMNALEITVKGGYVEGFITAINVTKKGFYNVTLTAPKSKPITLEVNQKTSLEKNGEPVQFFDYQVGNYAKAYYSPKYLMVTKFMGWDVEEIESSIGLTIKGYLVKIELGGSIGNSGRVTISDASGKLVVMNVDRNTQITLNDTPSSLRDLIVGDFVTVRSGVKGIATSIRAVRSNESLDQCEGYIVSIKVKGDILPVIEIVVNTKEYAKPMVFTLPISAEVWRDGKKAKGFELRIGDFVQIIYDEQKMNIIKIEAWTPTK
jgi:hypothetical protein